MIYPDGLAIPIFPRINLINILINFVTQEFGTLKIISGLKKIHGAAKVVMVKFF